MLTLEEIENFNELMEVSKEDISENGVAPELLKSKIREVLESYVSWFREQYDSQKGDIFDIEIEDWIQTGIYSFCECLPMYTSISHNHLRDRLEQMHYKMYCKPFEGDPFVEKLIGNLILIKEDNVKEQIINLLSKNQITFKTIDLIYKSFKFDIKNETDSLLLKLLIDNEDSIESDFVISDILHTYKLFRRNSKLTETEKQVKLALQFRKVI